MGAAGNRKILNVEITRTGQAKAVLSKRDRKNVSRPFIETNKACFNSVESFAQVLSDKNRNLLALIAKAKPKSLAELAEMSGRAIPNLSRTLRTMESHGLVELSIGSGRTVRPIVKYVGIRLDLLVVTDPTGDEGIVT